MTPIIQVWDLDIINCIEPAFSLGKTGSVKKNRARVGHKDAVLSLAWNKSYEHVLASGSVDKTILLWDLETKTPNTTITAFNEKVQCLQWHKLEAQTLLAGNLKIYWCTVEIVRFFQARVTKRPKFSTAAVQSPIKRGIFMVK